MAGEHDGMDQGNPSEEEYQRFRKMIDGVGREGLRRMVEHLTGRIEANPRDAEALSVRGLAYSRAGGAPPGGGGLRQGHRRGPRQCGRPPRQGPRLRQAGGAPSGGGGLRRRHPPGPRRRRGALQPGGVQGGAGRPCGGDERLRRGRHCWPPATPTPTTTGG